MTTQVKLPPGDAWTFHRLPNIITAHHIPTHEVLHIGAHVGEEVRVYRKCGFGRIRLVEPDPRNVRGLQDAYGDDPDIDIIFAAVAPTAGQAPLHLAERTVWSGLHPHPTATGQTIGVATVTLEHLQGTADVLVIDTQGTELDILRTANLPTLSLVVIETTRRPDDTAADYEATRTYMREQDWRIVEEWVHDDSGYHDCVYIPCGN